MDSRDLRRGLGRFPTGVAVVTARAPDGRAGRVTINSFASVSLEPPLVLWSLAGRAPSLAVFTAASHFAIHILADDQQELAERFCSPASDKFAGLVLTAGLGNAPLLEDSAALFECRRSAMHPGGDHVILVGEIERFVHNDQPPLVFHGGRYAAVAEPERGASYGHPDFDAWQLFYQPDPFSGAKP